MRKMSKIYMRAINMHRWCRRGGFKRVENFPPTMQLYAKYYYCPLSNARPSAGVVCHFDTRRIQVTVPD